jgi:C2 domain
MSQVATQIQRIIRGHNGRVKFTKAWHARRRDRAATVVQCFIRRRYARLVAAALARHKVYTQRVAAARKWQGVLLRNICRRHQRATQRPAVKVLRQLGLDPMAFTPGPIAYMTDLQTDFNAFMAAAWLEYHAWRTGGFDAFHRYEARTAAEASRLSEQRVTRGDAVIVVAADSPICGLTGRVLCITADTTDARHHVAEIRLDNGDKQVAYVPLMPKRRSAAAAANSNIDLNAPCLMKIDFMAQPQYTTQQLQSASKVIAAWATRENLTWKPYQSARHMQRIVRGFLARRCVARRRYQYWTSQQNSRKLLLNALQDTNTLSYTTISVLLHNKITPAPTVPTAIPIHSVVPLRYAAWQRQRMQGRILARELNKRMNERRMQARLAGTEFDYTPVTAGNDNQPEIGTSSGTSALYGPTPLYKQHSKLRIAAITAIAKLHSRRSHKRKRDQYLLQSDSYDTAHAKHSKTAANSEVFTGPHVFTSLKSSPHVRTSGHAMYHGNWAYCNDERQQHRDNNYSKSSSSNKGLVPHGAGYAAFLDGWGFSNEEMTLHILVIGCRDIPAMDNSVFVSGSDPFIVLKCNGITLRTTTQYSTLQPIYNEHFSIDVTDPSAALSVECWDEDTLGSDFIGIVNIPIR